MAILRIFEFLIGAIFAAIIVSAGKAIWNMPKGDGSEPKNEIRETVSAVLVNSMTGRKTVIRKRTMWERLTRRK